MICPHNKRKEGRKESKACIPLSNAIWNRGDVVWKCFGCCVNSKSRANSEWAILSCVAAGRVNIATWLMQCSQCCAYPECLHQNAPQNWPPQEQLPLLQSLTIHMQWNALETWAEKESFWLLCSGKKFSFLLALNWSWRFWTTVTWPLSLSSSVLG